MIKCFGLISLTNAVQLGNTELIRAQIHSASQHKCETLPVFPNIAQNVDCRGAIDFDSSCTHKCGENIITSTCKREMPSVNNLLIFMGTTKWEHK